MRHDGSQAFVKGFPANDSAGTEINPFVSVRACFCA